MGKKGRDAFDKTTNGSLKKNIDFDSRKEVNSAQIYNDIIVDALTLIIRSIRDENSKFWDAESRSRSKM